MKKYSELSDYVKKSLRRDWIITNGIGGYCAQSELGCNTRKYHGLLVAALEPPAKRTVILSKLDESIEINDKKYNLFSNISNGYISEGYKYYTDFKKEYVQIYSYKIEKVDVKKFICMQYGKNTVTILYRIQNHGDEAKLTLAPVLNFRDFHSINNNHHYEAKQSRTGNKVEVILDNNEKYPIFMYCSEGKYLKHINDEFYNMYYPREAERGFCAEENLYVPGVYSINIAPNEEKVITFVCSLDEDIENIDGIDLVNKEVMRLSGLIYDSELLQNRNINDSCVDMIKSLVVASDNFVVERKETGLHTIIAGYPWFLDWGRDTLISFEGLLLRTKRFNLAKEVLLTSIKDLKFGLVPNGYNEYNDKPLYNSADSSLLLIEQVYKYEKYTLDGEFVEKKMYPALKEIMNSYEKGIDLDGDNIYLDNDGLLSAGSENTQITWMDVKFDGKAVTPRNGKTVELNALWYNALKIMARLSEKMGDKINCKRYIMMSEITKRSFIDKFYNEEKHCLYDVLGDDKIRPNQLFALSLSHPIIDDKKMAKEILDTVKNKLLNDYGLKTLAQGEEEYTEVYEGSPEKRDKSYHQGITWVWLLGAYYDALRNYEKIAKSERKEVKEEIDEFSHNVASTFEKEMKTNASIGTISEIYDSRFPFEARGAFAQAWSVAEVLRIVINK